MAITMELFKTAKYWWFSQVYGAVNVLLIPLLFHMFSKAVILCKNCLYSLTSSPTFDSAGAKEASISAKSFLTGGTTTGAALCFRGLTMSETKVVGPEDLQYFPQRV